MEFERALRLSEAAPCLLSFFHGVKALTNAFDLRIPLVHIDCVHGPNEATMAKHILADAKAMVEASGGAVIAELGDAGTPGLGIHEMGTVRMGRDPMTSVLNAHNRAHEAPNLFCTDGAAMASSGCQNPSLTYMALTARAASYAAEQVKAGLL